MIVLILLNIEGSICLNATCSLELSKIIILSVTEEEDFILSYIEGFKFLNNKPITSSCTQMKVSTSLEISRDNNVFFLGGGTSSNADNSLPCISAICLDKEMKESASMTLNEPEMKFIFQMKRIDNSNCLVVAGFKLISFIEYDSSSKQFTQLKQIQNIHSGAICDLQISNGMIYSVSDQEDFMHKF